MGLSSKQVSSSGGLDWNQTLLKAQNLELPIKPHPTPMKKQQQQQSQQSEPLKCPRCDSTNTKFCYYNNYKSSQPRHFCRACKRHWTEGGTLRNVPVGGGLKKKRAKKSATPRTSATTATGNDVDGVVNTHMTIQNPHQRRSLSLCESLIDPPSLLHQQNLVNTRDLESKEFDIGNSNGFFLSSTLPLTQDQTLIFPFSTSSSNFDINSRSVSSTSLRSSNVYNFEEEFKTMEEPNINNIMPSITRTNTQSWEIPATSSGLEMPSYWSWEDIDSLVSTDLNVPWDDDSDIKP